MIKLYTFYRNGFFILLSIFIFMLIIYLPSFLFKDLTDSAKIICPRHEGGVIVYVSDTPDVCFERTETIGNRQRIYDSRNNKTICQGFCWLT